MKSIYLGLLAGFLTTSSAFPQLLKSYRTKSTKDLSLGYLTVILSGVALWIAYGFVISDVPVIVTNSLSFLPLSCTLYLKLRWDVFDRTAANKPGLKDI